MLFLIPGHILFYYFTSVCKSPAVIPEFSPSQTPVQNGAITSDRSQEEPQPSEKTEEKTKLVHSAALSNATAAQKPSLFTRRMFMLYGCLFVATFNSCINGYDGSLIGAINSYPQYRTYFRFPINGGTPSTGIVYAIYTIGNLCGSFAVGPATDFKGRRYGMFIGALIIIIGTCIQAPAKDLPMFMVGRFILGFGVAISASAGPAYVSEMAHPSYRGVMTGFYNTFWFIGGIPGTFTPYGTSVISGTNSWRIPIWLQMMFSGIVFVFALWLPETPRWLIANGRTEEALGTMAKYHGEGDRNSPIVKLEYQEMLDDISVTGSDKRWWDYRELFNSKDVRYRSMLVIAIAFFGQYEGDFLKKPPFHVTWDLSVDIRITDYN